MSGDTLKRAAAKLREHVQALPGTMTGPWFTRSGNVIADDGTDVGMLVADPYQPKDDGPLMAFIALLDPPVALALADWLEAAAVDIGSSDGYPPPGGRVQVVADEAAYAVARAILREEATS